MKDPSLTARLVKSMAAAANIDISVKCQIGMFNSEDDLQTLNQEDYQYMTKYISMIHNAGTSHVILHTRPAILSLSPVKNRVMPTLNYDFVNQIASDFRGKVKITMNGGITSLHQLSSLQSNDKHSIYSHMAGRWCLRRPLDLAAVEQTLCKKAIQHPQKCIDSYMEYALANQSKFSLAEVCLLLFLVVEQLREDYDQEEEGVLLSRDDMESLYDSIQDGLKELGRDNMASTDAVYFKQLAGLFKLLAETKVVNKWKRNRSEL
ncbi:hypothetical protein ACHAW5_000187 [Stephanodiscus triporus]|uniref:DUS-like FMN-binding domain-containing protein n=1 Tax=Stephanodiscus triporus TaxID=2934178 RepID=A0ABD3PAG7_9STRA